MTEKQLRAFKDGIANGLLDGENNVNVKQKYCRNSYKQGYDFGLTLYSRYNNLDEQQADNNIPQSIYGLDGRKKVNEK